MRSSASGVPVAQKHSTRGIASLNESITCVGVVVDPVLPLQLLNAAEVCFRMRARYTIAEWLERVQQCLLQAATDAHSLVHR